MIEVLIGMIASGKSTYARMRADEGAWVISHDDLTAMLHQRYRYQQDQRIAYRRVEESAAWIAIDCGLDVVIDRTHLSRESRMRWTTFAGRLGVECVAVLFPVGTIMDHARRRFAADPRGRSYEEWEEVATHHAAQWVADRFDGAAEGFSSVAAPLVTFRDATPPDGATRRDAIEVGRSMREMQRRFFAGDKSSLADARRLERLFDSLVAEPPAETQRDLFGG